MHVVACNYVHATTYDLISKPCYTYSRKTKETWILALLFNNSDITSPTSQDVNQFRSTTTGGTEWLLPHSQASAFFFCSVCYNTRKRKTIVWFHVVNILSANQREKILERLSMHMASLQVERDFLSTPIEVQLSYCLRPCPAFVIKIMFTAKQLRIQE